MYAVRGTNQTGELTGVVEGLLWLLQVCGNNGNAIMLIDSLYAANMIEGVWNAENSKNIDLVSRLAHQGAAPPPYRKVWPHHAYV